MPDEVPHLLAECAAAEIAKLAGQPLAPGLYLVATPIGNLGDITLRAISVLARADTVYCEDTRHSGVLLSHFGIRSPTRPYHEHNAAEQRPRILAELAANKRVALISDAGMPLISDPGFKLARDAAALGYAVISVPGASAVLTALTASGLPSDAFFFAGFLPPRKAARRSRIGELAAIPGSLVFFEAPQRTADTLADLADVLGSRPAVVARELTKLHEELARGRLDALAGAFAGRDTKGEVAIVVGPPGAADVSDEKIRSQLTTALRTMTLRDAAKSVAEGLGISKSRAYDIGLAMKRDGGK
jgi:16S rRNA (cytidine1402-2'-O)-methyltransferase